MTANKGVVEIKKEKNLRIIFSRVVCERPYNFFLADIRLPFDINVIDPAKEDKEMRLLAKWNERKERKKNY